MRCFKLTLSLNFVVSLRSNFFVFDSFLEFYGCIVCVSDCDCKKKKAIVVTPLQFTVFQHLMANNVQRILFWWCIMDFHKNSIRFEINHEIWNKRHEYALSNRHQFLCAIDNQQQQNRESVKSQNHIKTIRYVYMDLVALFLITFLCMWIFFLLFVCLFDTNQMWYTRKCWIIPSIYRCMLNISLLLEVKEFRFYWIIYSQWNVLFHAFASSKLYVLWNQWVAPVACLTIYWYE